MWWVVRAVAAKEWEWQGMGCWHAPGMGEGESKPAHRPRCMAGGEEMLIMQSSVPWRMPNRNSFPLLLCTVFLTKK